MAGHPLVTLASFESGSCVTIDSLDERVRASGIKDYVCFSFVLYEPIHFSTWFLRHMDISTLDSSVDPRSEDGWMAGWMDGWMEFSCVPLRWIFDPFVAL